MKRVNQNLNTETNTSPLEIINLLKEYSHDTHIMDMRNYSGPLGALYQKDFTEFRLWAPSASQVELILFDGYYGRPKESIKMTRSGDLKYYTHKLQGDHHGLTYRYRLTFIDSTVTETVDPYSKAVTVNGQRSVVVDLDKTNPEGWGKRMAPFPSASEAVIYEMHVRDFTVSSNSGILQRGKFLGVAEEGTVNPNGSATGIDYLKELGVTHVELLPIFDFQTVDETNEKPKQYNWGYDPQNFNAPEGSYATDPYDPFCRIIELKKMIQALHDAGIRVIMDVVFNHVYEVESHSFHKTVPGYFFRYNDNGEFTSGTGVGNDTASERFMMRKYILDSVKYWTEEYHIDGFRFDLMGIHDITTMNSIRGMLDEIDPSILLFGEGWDLYTPLSHNEVANHNNAAFMPRIGQFNDGLRDALKGNDFDAGARGFINGAWHMENKLARNFMGGVDFGTYNDPLQLIQYVEAHDNFTLYDRLIKADPYLDEDTIIRRHELATSIILLSQGIPFIHSGQEFLRTKQGVRDSYNKPDSINQIDWLRRDKYAHSVKLVKDLIQLRKSEPLFRLTSYEAIRETMNVVRQDYQIMSFEYRCPEYTLHVVFSAQNNVLNYKLPKGDYIIKLANGQVNLTDDVMTGEIDSYPIERYTALVLKKYLNK